MSRADHIHQARVYLAQARATAHMNWKATLLKWAAARRLAAMNFREPEPAQQELFA